MRKVGVSWEKQPKLSWAAPSASVIPIPEPRAVQDGDYVTGERRDKSGGALICPEEKLELGNHKQRLDGGEREAETPAALTSTPSAASGSY